MKSRLKNIGKKAICYLCTMAMLIPAGQGIVITKTSYAKTGDVIRAGENQPSTFEDEESRNTIFADYKRIALNEAENYTYALKLARDIANKIEATMSYPGVIKVNVIRETRAVEYAK